MVGFPTAEQAAAEGLRLHDGVFFDGDPANNIVPSRDPAKFNNAILAELVAVIKAGGVNPNWDHDDQLLPALLKIITDRAISADLATTEAAGIVELATLVEVRAGTDRDRAVTPEGVAEALKKYKVDNPVTISDASTSVAGVVQLATATEALAGTNNTKAITPYTLLSSFIQDRSPAGYIEFPGDVIIQWGAYNVAAGSSQTITFRTAFPKACNAIVTGLYEQAASDHVKVAIKYPSLTGFTALGDAVSGTAAGRFIAIGY